MAYNPNFTPWQSFNSVPNVGVVPTFQQLGTTPDQELIQQSYDAQRSLAAINTAARLKHLTDLNMALRRAGQAPGGNGMTAVQLAENNPNGFIPGNPSTTGFGMPSDRGIYPGVPVQWTPPLSAAQQFANARPVTAASASPYPRYNPDGSLPTGVAPQNARANFLNNILGQVSQDETSQFKNSWYMPLEPYYSPFEKQLMLAEARGGSARPPSNINAIGNAQATGVNAPRGTMPTANATLTDQRVRSNNDTRLAEQLIANGGITTRAQLEDQFPDADWNRLGSLLGAVQQGKQQDYQRAQSAADQYNQFLDKAVQDQADKQAEAEYQKGLHNLPWFGGGAARNALNEQYNQSVLDPQVSLSPDQIPSVERQYQNLIQYNPDSGTFIPSGQPPVEDLQSSGRISRQDMPGQNFHTDLQRSQSFNGLPIVRSEADYATLPIGAQAVTANGKILPPKGGYRGGPMYRQPVQNQDEFAQAFADNGLAAPYPRVAMPQYGPNQVNFGQSPGAPVGNRVNFFQPSNRPTSGNMVDFGRGSSMPTQAGDGSYLISSTDELSMVPSGAYFIAPDGIKRRKR